MNYTPSLGQKLTSLGNGLVNIPAMPRQSGAFQMN